MNSKMIMGVVGIGAILGYFVKKNNDEIKELKKQFKEKELEMKKTVRGDILMSEDKVKTEVKKEIEKTVNSAIDSLKKELKVNGKNNGKKTKPETKSEAKKTEEQSEEQPEKHPEEKQN